MKARMETRIDTLWSNQVICSVETELDNPHIPTTRHLSTMMAEALQVLAQELRSENERAGYALANLNRRQKAINDREFAADEREERLDAREQRLAEEREGERRED